MPVGPGKAARLLPAAALALGVLVAGRPARADTVLSPDGRVLLETGLPVQPGDQFIDPENTLWTVYRKEGERAVARRTVTLTGRPDPRSLAAIPRTVRLDLGESDPADVVVYHTHSDESYRPGDGTDSSPGKGGIYQVGASFVAAVQAQHLKAVQRPENHNPHDYGAYGRSRRTALQALNLHGPAALFDIHRDAGPGAGYDYQPGKASKVMIVIGRSNPAAGTNTAFARLIKEKADELHPGLVKGIFLGQGNYNQDISPRSLIFEFGTEETPRAEAEGGAALLAGAVVPVLREAGLLGSRTAHLEQRAAWHNALWLVVAGALLGAGGFVLMCGGPRPAWARIQQHLRRR
jgi:stage II sporulation protein P